ncbi:MAG: ABC transporter permease [Actinomycetota bacterium]|nr:ABC transporter permease [Actinomycetota bacterium]
MLRFVMRRLGAGLVLLLVISALAYVLLVLGSGDVARNILGVNATQEQTEALNEELGLNRPVLTQYVDWLGSAVTGDFGDTWTGSETVAATLTSRLSVTLQLVTGAVILAAILAAVLGVIAALRGGIIDRVVQSVGLIGFAVPGFLVAFALVTVFSLRFSIFRATGYVAPSDSVADWLRSVTLPILALSLATLASVSLQIRGSVKDILGLDYVRTLRSRGLSDRRVMFKHVLRNAAGPALSVLGVQFIGLLGGAVIVEQIFAIPGLGQTAVRSTAAGDIPLVMGLVVVMAVIVVVVNLTVDLTTAWLNPKVRHA